MSFCFAPIIIVSPFTQGIAFVLSTADALNFGVLFVVLDVFYGHGLQAVERGVAQEVGAAMMPSGILAPTLASVNFTTLPLERYKSCAHPLAPITTLAACQNAARDVILADATMQHALPLGTADQFVLASIQGDGCHFQLTPQGWSPPAANILLANGSMRGATNPTIGQVCPSLQHACPVRATAYPRY